MLINATQDYCCHGCTGVIRAGTRMSWVGLGHPYHASCSPESADVSQALQEVVEAYDAAINLNGTIPKQKSPPAYVALITATLLAELLIIGTMVTRNSSGYYILLRLVVCPLTAFFAYRLYRSNRPIFAVLIGFFAIMYNPILQVRLRHDTWQLINITTFIILAVALYLFRPQEKLSKDFQSKDRFSPFRTCEHCGQERVTLKAQFYENVSYFYERQQRSLDAKLCLPCAAKVFRRFTIRTLFGTWWGLIGFFLGPIILVFNTAWFLCMLIGFLWQMRHARTVGDDIK